MTDDKMIKRATDVYDSLCEMLETNNWKFERIPSANIVTFKTVGEDLPMDFIIKVDAEKQLRTLPANGRRGRPRRGNRARSGNTYRIPNTLRAVYTAAAPAATHKTLRDRGGSARYSRARLREKSW